MEHRILDCHIPGAQDGKHTSFCPIALDRLKTSLLTNTSISCNFFFSLFMDVCVGGIFINVGLSLPDCSFFINCSDGFTKPDKYANNNWVKSH